jgi:signal transduction histidine kinase/ligand-binding sensor domain-containing protein
MLRARRPVEFVDDSNAFRAFVRGSLAMMRVARASDGLQRTVVRLSCALLALSLITSATTALSAASEVPPLALMNHKTWTARDGAPQGVRALAQAPDGTLWVGSDGGLFNFDGLAFHAFHPLPGEPDLPAGSIFALHIARDGALWVATFQGAVRIASGHVTRYDTIGEVRASTANYLAEARDGSLWASGQSMLYRVGPDGKANVEAPPRPLSEGAIAGVFIDASDTLWIAQARKLYRRPLGGSEYLPTEAAIDLAWHYSGMADGSVWIADVDTKANEGRYQRVDREGRVVARVPYREMAFTMLPLADGSLLIGTQGHGLQRFRDSDMHRDFAHSLDPGSESFSRTDGLSATQTRALLVDSDGSIWAGGRRGLDRFRPAQLTPFLPEGVAEGDDGWSVCANMPGEVWVSYVNGLFRQTDGAPKKDPELYGAYLYCSRGGDVWLVNSRGIWDLRASPAAKLPDVPGFAPYAYKQVVSDSRGTVFAAVAAPASAPGTWKFEAGAWTQIAAGRAPLYTYVDAQDRLWTTGEDAFVERPLEHRRIPVEGSGPEKVRTLLETPLGMFAGGGDGIAVLRGDRFERLLFADPEIVRGTGSLIDSLDGDLWLNASRGIVHVRRAELEAALANPRHPMTAELVTEGEFVGPVSLLYRATAARDTAGNLWFATLNGVFHLDPAHLLPESHPPIVSIRSLTVDGRPVANGAAIPANPQTLEIQYLGVNLTIPERVTYQYRLTGFEDAWQDAGHRTEAIYARLPPGTYAFEVRASNGNGVWTEAVAAPAFTVTPAFYQTLWFRMLAAAAALLLLFGLVVLRFRVAARGIRARAEERADERIRIARDLHDTLLQGVQGLLLNVHVATEQTPDDAASKPMLQRALATADRIIIEGRDRLSSLRAERLTDAELISAIENVARDLAAGHTTRYRAERSGGTGMTLQPHVGDEIFYIAREALTNAFRHAHAREIEVEVAYRPQSFRLTCSDDGRGFDTNVDKRGHFGLEGMAERAGRLGGRFECRSEAGKGTRISVTIPAYRAYRGSSRAMYYLGRLRIA